MEFKFREKAFAMARELREIEDNLPGQLEIEDLYKTPNYRAADIILQLLYEGTHFGHCYQNENPDSCAYGDDTCPVMEYKEIEETKQNVSDMLIKVAELTNLFCNRTEYDIDEKRTSFILKHIGQLNKQIDAVLEPVEKPKVEHPKILKVEKSETGEVTDKGALQLYKKFIEEHGIQSEFDEWLNRD